MKRRAQPRPAGTFRISGVLSAPEADFGAVKDGSGRVPWDVMRGDLTTAEDCPRANGAVVGLMKRSVD